MKPRIRVKAPCRMYGSSIPPDAQPGDLLVGNRGAAARVIEPKLQYGGRVLTLAYVGNYDDGVRPAPGCKMYDFR